LTAHDPARSGVGGEGAPSLTADAIARLVGGRVVGDGSVCVRGVAPLDRARSDELSFLAQPRYAPLFARSQAGAVLIAPELAETAGGPACRIVVDAPHEAMLRVLPSLYPAPPRASGIHPTAIIARGASLGHDVSVGPYSVIGERAVLGDGVTVGAHCSIGAGVPIGAGSWLADSVTLYGGAVIGRRVRLHAGVRVACDGFGYVQVPAPEAAGGVVHEKIPHVGRCVLEDDVEVGANSTLDRGSIDDTVIGAGTKIDNLVHVAHNVRIGRLCLIMAQVGIAGSVRIGDGCILAGQVGVSGHHTVGDGARLAAQAGVFGDIPAGETWSGYPARPHKEALRAHAALFKLAGVMRRIEQLLAREDG
jgi:UDP-3-O-[3-hydroxymyristoyl] glucosamine N-acyltransferase